MIGLNALAELPAAAAWAAAVAMAGAMLQRVSVACLMEWVGARVFYGASIGRNVKCVW